MGKRGDVKKQMCIDEHVKSCGLSITAKKNGGKEEPEGVEISSFAHGSSISSGVVVHGRKIHQTVYSIFHFISSRRNGDKIWADNMNRKKE